MIEPGVAAPVFPKITFEVWAMQTRLFYRFLSVPKPEDPFLIKFVVLPSPE
jgi:hypothetical protein